MSSAYGRAMRSKRSNTPVLIGLILLVGGFGAIPLAVRKGNEDHNLLTLDKPLTGSQIQRGMYLNTGSQDAGPDPVSAPRQGCPSLFHHRYCTLHRTGTCKTGCTGEILCATSMRRRSSSRNQSVDGRGIRSPHSSHQPVLEKGRMLPRRLPVKGRGEA